MRLLPALKANLNMVLDKDILPILTPTPDISALPFPKSTEQIVALHGSIDATVRLEDVSFRKAPI